MPAKAKKPTRKNKPKKKVLKKALRGAIAPVEAVPIL
jgi:hypothetical protein